MRAVHLIRHGLTPANEKRLYCGATDVALSPGGISALRELRRSRVYPDISQCDVITSGLLRTEQTLYTLYGSIAHTVEPGLREMDFGAFEMRSYEELCSDEEYTAWLSGDCDKNRCPGGESGREMRGRALDAFEGLLERSERDLCIVTHGGVISAVMGFLFSNAGRNLYEWQPKNGEGYTVLFCSGAARSWIALPSENAR